MIKPKLDNGALVSGLKDQLTLLSFLVLFSGLVTTDTYYAGFGLRYQLLDLSLQHLTYRGISAIAESYTLGLAYLVAVTWLAVHPIVGTRWPRLQPWMQPSTYALVILVTIAAYLTSISAGRWAAECDLYAGRSSLPEIQSMVSTKGTPLPFGGYRLLLANKDRVAVFKPITGTAEVPFVHLLRGDDVAEIVYAR